MSRVIIIETKELKKIAALADRAVSAGPATLGGVEYMVGDPTHRKEDGLALAASRARKKAERLALSLGVNLGRVLQLTANEEPSASIFRTRIERGQAVQPNSGDEMYRLFVTIVFEINQPPPR